MVGISIFAEGDLWNGVAWVASLLKGFAQSPRK
jgi:hypothetical protein